MLFILLLLFYFAFIFESCGHETEDCLTMKDCEIVNVGHFKISNVCHLSYPCKHAIIETSNDGIDGDEQLMNGADIFYLLKNNGLSHVHFNCYEKLNKS